MLESVINEALQPIREDIQTLRGDFQTLKEDVQTLKSGQSELQQLARTIHDRQEETDAKIIYNNSSRYGGEGMKTNDIVINNVQKWLDENNKSHTWLADELHVSKALVGDILLGRQMLLPKRIEQLTHILGMSMKELTRDKRVLQTVCTVRLCGEITTRAARRELDALLFTIEDYIALQKVLK